jgi:hypothetical protein
MATFKRTLQSWFRRLGIGLTSTAELERLARRAAMGDDLDFLLSLPSESAAEALKVLSQSRSQIRQDLFVLATLGFKRDGYFVEFGATDGVELSNTHLLEKGFGWRGILAEPARCWHDALRANRSAIIETQCLWTKTGARLTFNEVEVAEYSTVGTFSDGDLHRAERRRGRTYTVDTNSLNDLLVAHAAPPVIDYLSIDTEGTEYEILRHFDFSKARFNVITCEHNDTPVRADIYALLTRHGYRRVLENVSRFDDWYVHESVTTTESGCR